MVGKIEILTDLKTLLLLLDPAPQALLALQILLDYPDPFLHPPTKRDLDMHTVNSFTHDCKTVIFTSWMRSWRLMTSRREWQPPWKRFRRSRWCICDKMQFKRVKPLNIRYSIGEGWETLGGILWVGIHLGREERSHKGPKILLSYLNHPTLNWIHFLKRLIGSVLPKCQICSNKKGYNFE